MPKVIGIKFKKSPKTYFFAPGDLTYTAGCNVLVETARGVEFGVLTMMPTDMPDAQIVQPLKPVIRVATEADRAQAAKMEAKRDDALRIAAEKIAKSGLEMKLTDAEYTFDGAKLILYFTAENRVDFRELVRELASTFKARIELRQVGSRDECKLKGGLGPCGRACCCCNHLSDFAHVTIKMAKNQNLSLNPGKISGLCGRLMCCLSYENAHYAETNKKMPKPGSEAETVDGKKGTVFSINQLKETVTLKVADKDMFSLDEYPLSKIKFKGRQASREEPEDAGDNDEELRKLED